MKPGNLVIAGAAIAVGAIVYQSTMGASQPAAVPTPTPAAESATPDPAHEVHGTPEVVHSAS
ncbi:hypothetical protein, partial [Tepidiforma sp.]|uniref:hypothetical protein n=1 Tax=Tepidiforma sp. TaxID=2682230 RepID=UPI002ADDBB8A